MAWIVEAAYCWVRQILNGNGDYYPGIRPMINAYMDMIDVDPVSMREIQKYLDFVSMKASIRVRVGFSIFSMITVQRVHHEITLTITCV